MKEVNKREGNFIKILLLSILVTAVFLPLNGLHAAANPIAIIPPKIVVTQWVGDCTTVVIQCAR